MNDNLTKTECAAMRGMAILAIILHNYCHFFAFSVKENEYTYRSYYNHYLWDHVVNMNKNVIFDLFSFFGHYGVPIFLFISGYGLVRKYEGGSHTVKSLPFIGYHYLKLLRLMIVGLIAYILVSSFLGGEIKFDIGKFIAQVAMVINLSPTPDADIKPGPYWYFGLMLQLYIVYRLFIYHRHWSAVILLMVVCWLAQIFCPPTSSILNYLRYNFVGSMLPFGIGIMYARYGGQMKKKACIAIALISTVVICLSGASYQLWFFIPAFIVTASLSMVKLMPAPALKALAWIGGISAAIFVIHPIMRPLAMQLSNAGYLCTGLTVYLLSSIAIAYLYDLLSQYIPTPRLNESHRPK